MRIGAAERVDGPSLRLDRLARLRAELERIDCAACVLLDPVSIRFATGARNMQVFMLRNPARYLFVPVEGPVILFEFAGCRHLAEDLETIDEIRDAITVSFVASGPRLEDNARAFAMQIGSLLRRWCGGRQRVAVERLHPLSIARLEGLGYRLVDAQQAVERARARKSAEEIEVMRAGLSVVERAVARMREALRPGITENALWSILHQEVIAGDGEYVETRLLSSGPRTNPWFQECSSRGIEAGDLVALDTDVVGPGGYYVDFSRTYLCGDRPSDHQRMLHDLAREQLEHDVALVRPGVTFRELAEQAWPIPEAYAPNRYFVLAHGVGLTGEYPYVLHARDLDRSGYDGVIEPNMTLCVESYIGAPGDREGVKLEEQLHVTESGVERMSQAPFGL